MWVYMYTCIHIYGHTLVLSIHGVTLRMISYITQSRVYKEKESGMIRAHFTSKDRGCYLSLILR